MFVQTWGSEVQSVTNCTHSLTTQSVHTVYTHSLYTQSVHTVCTHRLYTQTVHVYKYFCSEPILITHPSSLSSLATGFLSAPPTANIHACGGLITAEKLLMPYIPRLEMVKVPPWNSSGLSRPDLAFSASSLVSWLMRTNPWSGGIVTKTRHHGD